MQKGLLFPDDLIHFKKNPILEILVGLTQRPYIGTWQVSGMNVVQHSPDALVFFNGSLNVPGCYRCDSQIDVQKYIVGVTVDASNEPSGMSASINMSIPRHAPDSLSQDANYILRPGLEVHIYMKGYFPFQGQFDDVPKEDTAGIDITNMLTYPYYMVFHGVTTDVNFSYSGGFREVSINCGSMLHFWNFQNMSSNGAFFGAKPSNSGMEMSLVGNKFNGWTPHAIIYYLYQDSIGNPADVAYVLSDKTNVDGISDFSKESLYSMSIKYWNKRFKERMINLRMHGVSGEVLSTPQAIFLSRTNANSVRKLLNSYYKRGQDDETKLNIFSAAKTLGLFRSIVDPITGEVRNYDPTLFLDAVRDPKSGDSTKGIEYNVADMAAFVQSIGQFGDMAIFETTYQSKMDVLNRVLEVTGWEFYQDMDGDFVFKPPMYNLDTRNCRPYVMRKIDIISINSTSKEPECTYVTTNNNHFKNLSDMGTEGFIGVRGQFMDYKLISQFGWRPFSFETSYFTDSTSLLYNAVGKMDVLNSSMNTGSLTIPIRPELRPGYPVYIEPYDCFYYVTGINHSMVYGEQCTTSLTLTAKRDKFYAPGVIGEEGIKSIRLDVTTLPAKPLEVLNNNGEPELSGFPNVVMALDPEAINPLYFSAGFDLLNLDDEITFSNLLRIAVESGVLKDAGNGKYTMYVGEDVTELSPNADGEYAEYSASELFDEANKYIDSIRPDKATVDISDKIRIKEEELRETKNAEEVLNNQISDATGGRIPEAQKESESSKKSGKKKELDKLLEKKKGIENELAKLKEDLRKGVSDDERKYNTDVNIIKKLVDQVMIKTNNMPNDDFKNPSRLNAYLDILAEKKSMFAAGRPGNYRYYSSSHPESKHQGQRRIVGIKSDGGSPGPLVEVSVKRMGYLDSEPILDDSWYKPEAAIGEIEVNAGFTVATTSGIKIKTTDQIQTLSFCKHDLDMESYSLINATGFLYDGLSEEYIIYLNTNFVMNDSDINTKIVDSSAKTLWNTLAKGIAFPSKLGDIDISTLTIIDYYNTKVADEDEPEASDDPTGNILNTALKELNMDFVEEMKKDVNTYLLGKFEETKRSLSEAVGDGQKSSAKKNFMDILNSVTDGRVRVKKIERSKKEDKKSQSFYSPIFPVSDDGGYNVIGNYRYGRGLTVGAHSTMEEIAKQDPFKYATPEAVEDYLDALQGKGDSDETDSDPLSEAEKKLVDSINNNPYTPELLKREINGEGELSNKMIKSDEAVFKVPVANAAVFLSNINPSEKQCMCRAKQADVKISAYGSDKFLYIDSSMDLDELSKFQSDIAVDQSLGWNRYKNAIAGSTYDSGRENIFKGVESAFSSDRFGSLASSSLNSLNNAISDLDRSNRDTVSDLENIFSGEDDEENVE